MSKNLEFILFISTPTTVVRDELEGQLYPSASSFLNMDPGYDNI